MNLLIRRFKIAVVELFNSTPLPIEVKRLVLAELMTEINQKSDEIVNEELEADSQKQESEDE